MADIQEQSSINIQASLNGGQEVAESAKQVTNKLKSIGGSIYDKYSNQLAEINAQKDIRQQQELIANGEDPHFSNVGVMASILNPSYAKAYNESINRVAVPIAASKIGLQIQQLSQDVKLSQDIPSRDKVRALSEQINKTLPDALDNIPDAYRGQVSSYAYSQSTQELSGMMSFTGKVALEQQKFATLESFDDIEKLGRNSNNITDAYKQIDLSNQAIDAAIENANISSESGLSRKNYNKISILSGTLVNMGEHNVAEWNKRNGNIIEKDDVEKIQSNVNTAYNQQQHQIELSQLQHGFSMEDTLLKISHGIPAKAPSGGYSDYEKAQIQAARTRYNLKAQSANQDMMLTQEVNTQFNKFKLMNPAELINLEAGNIGVLSEKYALDDTKKFLSLPSQVQNKTISLVKQYQNAIKDNPYFALEMPKPLDFSNPEQVVPNKNFDLNKTLANISNYISEKDIPKALIGEQLPQLIELYKNNPIVADKVMRDTFQQYSSSLMGLLSSYSGNDSGYGITPNLPNNYKDAYLIAKQNKMSVSKNITKEMIKEGSSWYHDDDWFKSFQNMQPSSQAQALDVVNSVVAGSHGTIDYKNAFNKSFDIYDGMFVKKGDADVLSTRGLDSLKTEHKLPSNSKLSYINPSNDVYGFVDEHNILYPNSTMRGVALREYMDKVPHGTIDKIKYGYDKFKSVAKEVQVNE